MTYETYIYQLLERGEDYLILTREEYSEMEAAKYEC